MKWLLLIIGAITAFIFGVALLSPPKNLETPDGGVEKTILVGPTTIMCEGVSVQRCYQIKEQPEDDWQNYYGEIEGFDHKLGNEYNLRVVENTIDNPPADTSTTQLTLVEILDWKEVPYIAITSPVDHDNVPVGEPVVIKGSGRGLFENNVVVQIGAENNLVATEYTTMQTPEVGGEGTWELIITAQGFVEDTLGEISAYSPSPKDGEDGYRYTIPVVYSVTGGNKYSLEGTNWVLKSLMKEDISGFIPPAGTITVLFEDGRVSGKGGCNNYFGSYTLERDNGISMPGPFGSTLMACPEPLMSQEYLYLGQLEKAAKYNVRGIELLILNENGESLLIYNTSK